MTQHGETIFAERKVMTAQRPYTMTGLARSLGVSRNTILKYEDPQNYPDEISDEDRQAILTLLGLARYRAEEFAETSLYGPYSNGAKFALTNNHKGWADKVVQGNHSGGAGVTGGAGARRVVVI